MSLYIRDTRTEVLNYYATVPLDELQNDLTEFTMTLDLHIYSPTGGTRTTQDKCAEIRSWWKVYFETIIGDKDNLVQLAHAQRLALQVPVLLDALEELKESNDYYKNKLYKVQQELKDTIENRDRWKARAEALERAIKDWVPCVNCTNYPCGDDDVYSCKCSDYSNWRFDEARFSGTKEAEVDGNENQ